MIELRLSVDVAKLFVDVDDLFLTFLRIILRRPPFL
jgi:hypothetical protein